MKDRAIEAALGARKNAYAPYSGYRVGAAVVCADGTIWDGCNVENVSFGLTVCAERSAVVHMVGSGRRVVVGVAVATEDGGAPCGMCLQTLREFAPDAERCPVWMVDSAGQVWTGSLAGLFPNAFASSQVRKVEE